MTTSAENQAPWVIPYIDQPPAFWERLFARHAPRIRAVYLPLPDAAVGSGRPRQPDKFIRPFLALGLPVSFLVNPVVLNEPAETSAGRILPPMEQWMGKVNLTDITVTDLLLAREIRKALPGVSITASVLMDIFQPRQLALLEGVCNTLVPSSRVFRELESLKALKRGFSGKIRLMVNEACLPDCPYRVQHFHEMSRPNGYPKSLCDGLLERQPWRRLTGAWVLPQHLNLFDGVYDELKLAGRVTMQDPAHYVHVLDAYMAGTPLSPHEIGGGPASPLDPIPIDTGFFRNTLACGRDCGSCDLCADHWRWHSGAGATP